MSNSYEHVIPAASGTIVLVQRVPGEDSYREHRVAAWASVNGGPLEALVDVNDTGELTPMSVLRRTSEDVFTVHPRTDRA